MIPPPPVHTAAHIPPPARVPDVGRTVALAIAWRIERTEIAPLRAERADGVTARVGHPTTAEADRWR